MLLSSLDIFGTHKNVRNYVRIKPEIHFSCNVCCTPNAGLNMLFQSFFLKLKKQEISWNIILQLNTSKLTRCKLDQIFPFLHIPPYTLDSVWWTSSFLKAKMYPLKFCHKIGVPFRWIFRSGPDLLYFVTTFTQNRNMKFKNNFSLFSITGMQHLSRYNIDSKATSNDNIAGNGRS